MLSRVRNSNKRRKYCKKREVKCKARKIPTAAEVREYQEKTKNGPIRGPEFPGETIWRKLSTLLLLEAAEEI